MARPAALAFAVGAAVAAWFASGVVTPGEARADAPGGPPGRSGLLGGLNAAVEQTLDIVAGATAPATGSASADDRGEPLPSLIEPIADLAEPVVAPVVDRLAPLLEPITESVGTTVGGVGLELPEGLTGPVLAPVDPLTDQFGPVLAPLDPLLGRETSRRSRANRERLCLRHLIRRRRACRLRQVHPLPRRRDLFVLPLRAWRLRWSPPLQAREPT